MWSLSSHFFKVRFIGVCHFLKINFFSLCCSALFAVQGAFSSCHKWELLFIVVCRLLIAVAFLFWGRTGSRLRRQCLQHMDSVVVAHGLSCPMACGILLDEDRTHVPCTGRQVLNHWTTRKDWVSFFSYYKSLLLTYGSSIDICTFVLLCDLAKFTYLVLGLLFWRSLELFY